MEDFKQLSGLKTWKQKGKNGEIIEVALKDMDDDHLNRAIATLKKREAFNISEIARLNYNNNVFHNLLKDINTEQENRLIVIEQKVTAKPKRVKKEKVTI